MIHKAYIAALAAVAVVAFLFGSCGKSGLRDRADAALALAAQRDTLRLVAEDSTHAVYEQLGTELDNQRQINAVLRDSIPPLYDRLRMLGAEIRTHTSTIIELEDLLASGAGTDTVIISAGGDSVHQVSFDHQEQGIGIKGWTRSPPPTYQLTIRRDPIPISVTISELRSGAINTNITAPPWVNITLAETMFDRYKPGWFKRNLPWITLTGGLILGIYLAGL